jgi:hypothetical protein
MLVMSEELFIEHDNSRGQMLPILIVEHPSNSFCVDTGKLDSPLQWLLKSFPFFWTKVYIIMCIVVYNEALL